MGHDMRQEGHAEEFLISVLARWCLSSFLLLVLIVFNYFTKFTLSVSCTKISESTTNWAVFRQSLIINAQTEMVLLSVRDLLSFTGWLMLNLRICKLICEVKTILRRINYALDRWFSQKWLPGLTIAPNWLFSQRTSSTCLELVYLSNVAINVYEINFCALVCWSVCFSNIWIWSHFIVSLHGSESHWIFLLPFLGCLIEVRWFLVLFLESA